MFVQKSYLGNYVYGESPGTLKTIIRLNNHQKLFICSTFNNIYFGLEFNNYLLVILCRLIARNKHG